MAKARTQTRTGTIRIISGQWRGRKLPVKDLEGLRPTTDRVKETLFNWLMQDVRERRCLDLFAGAGSLGFEAASRGAAEVVMCELNSAAAQQLQRNLDTLGAHEQIRVVQGDALSYLNQPPQPFELVFIDPPFRKGLIEKVLQRLAQGWLAEGALVYLESEQEWPAEQLPPGWQLLKQKIAGQVAYRLLQV